MWSLSASPRLVLWLQASAYFASCLLSLFSSIALGLNQDEFRGHCLLFSAGQWRETDGQLVVQWASQAYCNLAIFVSVVTCVISCFQFFRLGRLVCRAKDASFLAAFLDVLVSLALCLAMLVVAIIITLGYRSWCSLMTERFDTCDNAADNDIDHADAIDASSFPLHMGIAQLAMWSSFVCLVTALVFGLLKLCRYHYEENLRVSMARERKRLINDDQERDNFRQFERDQPQINEASAHTVAEVDHHEPPPDLVKLSS